MWAESIKLLVRWMALDFELHYGTLRLPEFAERWLVDPKTIRRDLQMFKRLGYAAESVTVKPGVDYLWRYPEGQRPMFTASLEQ